MQQKCSEWIMTLLPDRPVNIYEGVQSTRNLREKLAQWKARDVTLEALYKTFGMKFFVLREVDARGVERRQCALKPDHEFMKSLTAAAQA